MKSLRTVLFLLSLIFLAVGCTSTTEVGEEELEEEEEESYEPPEKVELKPTFNNAFTESEIRDFAGEGLDAVLIYDKPNYITWFDSNESYTYELIFVDEEGTKIPEQGYFSGILGGEAIPDSQAVYHPEEEFRELNEHDHFYLTIRGYDIEDNLIAESKQMKIGFLKNKTNLVFKQDQNQYEQDREFFEEYTSAPVTKMIYFLNDLHMHEIKHYSSSDDPGFSLTLYLSDNPAFGTYNWTQSGDYEAGEVHGKDDRYEVDDILGWTLSGETYVIGNHSFFIEDDQKVRVLEFEVDASGESYGDGEHTFGIEGYVRMIIRDSEIEG